MIQTTLTGEKLQPHQPKHSKTTGVKSPNAYANAAEQLSLTETQGKLHNLKSLIYPTGPALNHPAADVLLTFGTNGCPVECGPQWTPQQIQDAIDYAAHPSAQVPDAAAQLRQETLEKIQQGYARLVKWEDIKANPPHS